MILPQPAGRAPAVRNSSPPLGAAALFGRARSYRQACVYAQSIFRLLIRASFKSKRHFFANDRLIITEITRLSQAPLCLTSATPAAKKHGACDNDFRQGAASF
jgi:hypothetical protein